MNSPITNPTGDSSHPLEWRDDNVPVSAMFDDPFFSKQDGRAETRHVFIDGNNLPQRWCDGAEFTIGELGFGTGLNFLETWKLWQQTRSAGQVLTFVSIEAFPLNPEEMSRALSTWTELRSEAEQLLQHWPDVRSRTVQMDEQTNLRVFERDVVDALRLFPKKIDAWYLDGFSPAKNQEMWSDDVMQLIASNTSANGTFATYTSAGWVRRNLEEAGFVVDRADGFGKKRHMSVGTLESSI